MANDELGDQAVVPSLALGDPHEDLSLWARRGAFIAALIIPPALYVLFVTHYATNVLLFDDWNMAPFLHSALSGHFSWGALWSQYGEPRIPLTRGVFLVFASLGNFDARGPIFLSAFLLIAGYGALLGMAWRYLGDLRALLVLALGVVWFSLAAVQSALFAFEVGWYFVIAGSMGMLAALVVPRSHRAMWLGVAIAMAVIASLGFIQGFIAWPLGLVCLVWSHPRRSSVVAWVMAAIATAAVYLIGYSSKATSCSPSFGCTPTSVVGHPLLAFRWFVILLGNTIPGQYVHTGAGQVAHVGIVRYEAVGGLFLAAAVFVIVQSVRRRSDETIPVPMLLVLFGLLFDAVITWGRIGSGLTGPVIDNRYGMGNLVLLTGIVLYGAGRLQARDGLRGVHRFALAVVLISVVLIQAAVSTAVGITAARTTDSFLRSGARVVANIDRIPVSERSCELLYFVIPEAYIDDARAAHLAELGDPYEALRREGPPPLLAECR